MEEEDTNPLPQPIAIPAYKPAWESSTKVVQSDEDLAQAKAEALGNDGIPGTEFIDSVSRSFKSGGNIAVQIYNDIERISSSGEADPDWSRNVDKWADTRGVNDTQRWRYKLTKNQMEADALLADSVSQARDLDVLSRRAGVSTFIASGLAGVVDIDLPITLMTGGMAAGAKLALNATRAGKIATGMATGTALGTTLGVASYGSDPNADWTVIPTIGLGGMAFGGVGGMMSRVNTARIRALDEVGENVAEGLPRAKEDLRTEAFSDDDPYGSMAAARAEAAQAEALAAEPKSGSGEAKRAPTTISVDELAEGTGHKDPEVDYDPYTAPQGRGSIGAAQLNQTGQGIGSINSTRVQDMIMAARKRVGQLGIDLDYRDGFRKVINANGSIGKAAARFQDIIDASPIASDFGKMMRSGSAVAQSFAFDVMENATGIIRNGRSAARIMEHYKRDLLGSFMDPYHGAYSDWSAKKYQAGFVKRNWDEQMRAEFDREVFYEMQSRKYDGVSQTKDPAIKQAADAIDRTFKREIEVLKGRAGETDVAGSDTLTPQAGYVPQKWLGRNMRALMNRGRTKDDIANAIAEGYQRMHGINAKDALIYAKAVVDRSLRTDQGANTGLLGVLSKDGRAELTDMLDRNGMSPTEIESFINRITKEMEERGRAGFTKQRTDIDLRLTASNGIAIIDLVDTDLSNLVPKRLSRSAGQAALARKGVRSRADFEEIKRAIREEQAANGPDAKSGTTLSDRANDLMDRTTQIDDEFMEGVYSYFNGAPIAGGVSPMYARMKKLTNLALLNQLGLTQLAEFGPMIASVGLKRFYEMAGKEIRDNLHNIDSPLVQELKHMNVFIPEENLFRDDLVFEFEKVTSTNEFARRADRLMNKAQRIQGFTSGFYQVRKLQQRIAVTTAADRLARHFRDGGVISDARLYDMGMDAQAMTRLSYYVNQGIVEFDAKGNLLRLNMKDWDPVDADHFSMTLNASVNTLVQKAMVGESSMIFHKDGMAQLFWHLKSFPMLALEKQALRSLRIMDNEAAAAFMYGLATAGAAYTVRQVVNGRTDRLDFDDIAKGAFGLSNMTGWIPMWTDPLAGMLGMEGIGFSGPRGPDVVAIPAALDVLNRMAKVPGAVLGAVADGPNASELNAIRAIPIIGNAYGFAYMWNAMK